MTTPNDEVKAAIQSVADAIIDVAGIVKKKEAALQTGVDSVVALVDDTDLHTQVGKIMTMGISNLLTQLKAMASTAALGDDLTLAVEEIPVFQKVIAALTA